MRVYNIVNTSENTCACDSWLDHWKKFSRQSASYCSVNGCYERPEVGGHVQKTGNFDKNWYIVPLCKGCNAKNGAYLDVNDSIKFVSAKVDETCGRA